MSLYTRSSSVLDSSSSVGCIEQLLWSGKLYYIKEESCMYAKVLYSLFFKEYAQDLSPSHEIYLHKVTQVP